MSIDISDEQLNRLAVFSRKLAIKQQRAGDVEEELKQIQADIRDLETQIIPDLMTEIGVEALTLTDGTKVQVKPFIAASITKANEDEAHQWLKDHGFGDLIRERTVTNVHPSTLKAWARERVEAGDNVPEELFSLYVGRKASIR